MRKRNLTLKKLKFIAGVILGLGLVSFYFFADHPYFQTDNDFNDFRRSQSQTQFSTSEISSNSPASSTFIHRQTPPHNFSQAKKLAKQLFAEQGVTFYCNCPYDKHGNVDIKACGYRIQKDKRRAERLEWEHLVPVSLVANHLPCWRGQGCNYKSQGKGKGECLKGRRCCQKIDPRFQAMEADLHNLVPEVGELNALRSNYRFGMLPHVPAGQLGECRFKIDPELRRVEPEHSKRGVIARAHLYMASTYGFRLSDSQRQLFQAWNRQHPPEAWEIDWNDKIAKIQNNHNTYISDYERMK